MNKTQTEAAESTNAKLFLFGGIGAVFFVCSALLIVAYAVPGDFARALRGKLFLPMAVVDGKAFISFREVSSNLSAIRHFYEAQDFSEVGLRVDFSSEEGKKRLQVREKELINKLIEDRAIERIARNQGIIVTDEMIDQGVMRKLDEFGSTEKVVADLERLYGWSLDDFKKKIVAPALYEEELRKVFLKEENTAEEAKVKISEAEADLARGTSFEVVAAKHSDGRTAKDGGKLGWFSLGDLAPELQKGVEAQRIGMAGPVIESSLGFHIVLVEGVKEESGEKRYQIRQIFSKKAVFSDWLSGRMKGMGVWVFDDAYDWNSENSRIEFRDASMKTFEEELVRNKTGDAAFLFY